MIAEWAAVGALAVFALAYAAAMAEEWLHLRKSVPMLIAAGVVWTLIGVAARGGAEVRVAQAAEHNLLEFAELFLFLVVAMTYVNTMDERGVFGALRAWLVSRGLSLRALFWATGALAFVLSPVADNLTTALVMGAVVMTVGRDRPRFVALGCTNVVVAANAGGAFSPFGDVTTLMVWQAGIVPFTGFFGLVVPALVNWLVPAAAMSRAVEAGAPPAAGQEAVVETGAATVVLLFGGTIAVTVALHGLLDLPPALGMMLGLGVLSTYGSVFNRLVRVGAMPIVGLDRVFVDPVLVPCESGRGPVRRRGEARPIRTYELMEKVEWDTLMFFFGVIMCVGGLGALGYLDVLSGWLYRDLGATRANVLVGALSAVVDNVPVMFAVLAMRPEMPPAQWLLVTLTTGVGGSLLSLGSAAGVALMGQARGTYTFMAHLRWSWAIALGYAASVGAHLLVSRQLV